MELLTCFYVVCTNIFGFGFHSSMPSHVDEWTFRKWLWIYSDNYISKWPNWAQVFTIKTDEWWPISSWPLRVHKFRRDFNFRALVKKGYNFMKRRSNSWEPYAWRQKKLFNALIRSLDEKSNEKFEINYMLLSCHVRVSEWIHTL